MKRILIAICILTASFANASSTIIESGVYYTYGPCKLVLVQEEDKIYQTVFSHDWGFEDITCPFNGKAYIYKLIQGSSSFYESENGIFLKIVGPDSVMLADDMGSLSHQQGVLYKKQ